MTTGTPASDRHSIKALCTSYPRTARAATDGAWACRDNPGSSERWEAGTPW